MRYLLMSLLLFVGVVAFAQTSISGNVIDVANGEPIIGASVLEVGTTNGTITDFDGNFELIVKSGATLQFSYMGYKTIELPAQAVMSVKMGEDTEVLDEVVVVGYGVVKKNDATGSVTAIKPDAMNKGLQTNAQDMLQGKIAGVNITSDGGAPGGGASIRIRGGSSLSASNSPLIVIDGLAMDNNGIPGAGNPLSMVNPNDIETFTVLKDASATAIYGSRASNGVIIITTKKGNSGAKPKVSYDGNMSIGTLTNRLQTLTGDEMRSFANALGKDPVAMSYLGVANTDWQNQIYRTAVSTDHNISIMGGYKDKNVDMPYRASVGYTLNNGTIKTSQMQRVTAAFNLNPSFLDKHLIFNVNAKGMYIYNSYEPGVVGTALAMDPTQPVTLANGDALNIYGDVLMSKDDADKMFAGYYQPTSASSYNDPDFTLKPLDNCPYNPASMLASQQNTANSAAFVGNAEVTYKVHGLEDLILHANFGADYSYGKQTYRNSKFGTANHYYGYDGYDIKNKYNLQFNCYASYGHDWEEAQQHFDAMVGYEWQQFYNDVVSEGSGFYGPNSQVVMGGMPMAGKKYAYSTHSFKTRSALVSFFGRVNWTGWNQVMLTATVRGDGSSRFAPNHRWGVFPSVALGWKIKETFLKDVNAINDLKLRLGYGITGQQEINQGDYPYLANYTVSENYAVYYPVGIDGTDGNSAREDKYGQYLDAVYDENGNKLYYSYRPNAYNKDLTWEKTTTYNAGIDFAFLNNRISGSIDYYFRNTTDLLNTIPVATGTNFRNRCIANVGSLQNQGVEFSLNAVVLDYGKKFKWDLGYNVTYNQNKITQLNTGEEQTAIETGGISSGTGNKIQVHAVGQAANTFHVYEARADYDDNGKKIWYVVDRNKDGKIDVNDKYYFHSAAAPVTMGFQTKFQFYNFDLGMSFRANIGNYVYNDVKASNLQFASSELINKDGYFHGLLASTFDTYYNDGMTNDQLISRAITDPATGAYVEGRFSEWFRTDYFVENASFFRCDNITLGYSFQAKNFPLSGRAFCTISNPFVISKYSGLDPEVNGGIDNNIYPRSMTTVLGLSLQF